MLLLAAGCFTSVSQSAESPTEPPPTAAPIAAETALSASVTAFSVIGYPGTYTFDVTVRSPDIGCEGYADWWEVVSTDGDLLYRRVLLHSHVDEQPFSRSGGPSADRPRRHGYCARPHEHHRLRWLRPPREC